MLSHVLFAPLLVLSLSLGLTMGQNISHVVTKTVYQPLFQLEIELFNELLETCTFTINRLENGKLDLFEDEQLGTCSEFAAPLYNIPIIQVKMITTNICSKVIQNCK